MTAEMPIYLSHVLYLCSSLLDGSICSAYDVRYFFGHSHRFTICYCGSVHANPISKFHIWFIHICYCGPCLHLAFGMSLGPDIITLRWLEPWDGTNLDSSFMRLGLTLPRSCY